MKNKPDHKPLIHKPKRIEEAPPQNLTPDEQALLSAALAFAPQTWRHANFLILYQAENGGEAMAVDLNGKTLLRHRGPLEDVFGLVNVLQHATAEGRRIYDNLFVDWSDEDFLERGLTIMEAMTSDDDSFDRLDDDN
jgi:hypothetical protein